MDEIYAEKVNLKPGDNIKIELKLNISTTREVTFDKIQLEMYLYKKAKDYLEERINKK